MKNINPMNPTVRYVKPGTSGNENLSPIDIRRLEIVSQKKNIQKRNSTSRSFEDDDNHMNIVDLHLANSESNSLPDENKSEPSQDD